MSYDDSPIKHDSCAECCLKFARDNKTPWPIQLFVKAAMASAITTGNYVWGYCKVCGNLRHLVAESTDYGDLDNEL